MPDARLPILTELEKKVLWLASWTIHNANHLRPNDSGLKVGGHQASSASLSTILTALYFAVLKPEDRVAVKPHAGPAFHAIQYLLGRQSREKLINFRGYKGAQSYPSRTKDGEMVDFSTGSVGLGVAQTLFASLVQDYVHAHGWAKDRALGRMVALIGDAEMDEGNIFEALLEGWKQGVQNIWWIIDYNRQSLDAIAREGLFARLEALFQAFGWNVVALKYGKLQEAAFAEPGGERLRAWIDACPNTLYSSLLFQGGAAWRKRLNDELGDQGPVSALIARRSDSELAKLMADLGGHDMATLLEAFESRTDDPRPTVFIAYTVKGFGLPLQGHKDNHAGLMTGAQMAQLQAASGVRQGHEWDKFEGLNRPAEIETFLKTVPFVRDPVRRLEADIIPIPQTLPQPKTESLMSAQQGFGLILAEIARGKEAFAERIVTTSPDVTVSTNLGGWVNRRKLFGREHAKDIFRTEKIPSTYVWDFAPEGQHMELGIAEMNLFILLSALGLSHHLFGERLLPVGTLYDAFIPRGLDALNYACYQDARFLLVATPSGITRCRRRRRTPVGRHPADRHGAGRAGGFRTGFRRRAVGDVALRLRLHAAQRRSRARCPLLAARCDRRLGLSAPLHPAAGATAPGDDPGIVASHRGRRLLAPGTGAQCRGHHRLSGRGGAGSDRRGRPAGRRPPRYRASGGHLRRPAQCRLDGGTAGPRKRPCARRQSHRKTSQAAPPPLRHRHRA